MKFRDYIPNTERNPLFCQVSDETLAKYFPEKTWHIAHFSAGEVIYSFGLSEQDGIRVGIIASGGATVHTSNQHSVDHALLRSLKAGDMFGIANLYAEDEPFPSTIIASESCEILFIEASK